MHALVLYACVAGTNCPPFVLTDQIASQFECMFGGQAKIAEFMADRPKWHVEKFVCIEASEVGELTGGRQA